MIKTDDKHKVNLTEEIRAKKADHITWIGFFSNLVLAIFKLIAGIIGKSSAMIADAIHSISDFATDIVVLASFKVVRRPADTTHHYGHGKFETLATAIIGVSLLAVGAGIAYNSSIKIFSFINGEVLNKPGLIAFYAAIFSLVMKEWLFRYTKKIGDEIKSPAVVANAWHHRSDAFSSIGTLLGISGAIFLGDDWRVLDPIAALIVSFFIVFVAIKISFSSLKELLEESLDEETNKHVMELIKKTPGVIDPHNLRTRKIGSNISVDIHIRVKRDLTIVETHEIATDLENRIRECYGQSSYISVHTEPEKITNNENS